MTGSGLTRVSSAGIGIVAVALAACQLDAPNAPSRHEVALARGSGGSKPTPISAEIVDLGTLPGGSPSFATDVNAGGVAVGYSYTGFNYSGLQHAVRWTPSADSWLMADLSPSLGGSSLNSAHAINDNGDVVGYMRVASGDFHAFVLTGSGGLTDLGSLPGRAYTYAWGINNNGEVVGDGYDPADGTQQSYRAFYWTAAGGMVELPTLGGATGVRAGAQAISDDGTIVGYSKGADPSGIQYAVRWRRVSGVWTISMLPSAAHTLAVAINDNGDIVGHGCDGSPCRAFLWPAAGGRVDLGTLGGVESSATDVNGAGTVVGYSLDKSGHQRAFRWTLAEGMRQLTGLLGNKTEYYGAESINEAGVAVGFSQGAAFPSLEGAHAVLWKIP